MLGTSNILLITMSGTKKNIFSQDSKTWSWTEEKIPHVWNKSVNRCTVLENGKNLELCTFI
jgi:hypothetical protein